MTKTNLTKLATAIALITVLCLTVSAQGLSDKEDVEARVGLARNYGELLLKLFPLNADMVITTSRFPVPREGEYALFGNHRLYNDSMADEHSQELQKIADWIENNRDKLERLGVCEVGLSSNTENPYMGKSFFVRNKDGEWRFKTDR